MDQKNWEGRRCDDFANFSHINFPSADRTSDVSSIFMSLSSEKDHPQESFVLHLYGTGIGSGYLWR